MSSLKIIKKYNQYYNSFVLHRPRAAAPPALYPGYLFESTKYTTWRYRTGSGVTTNMKQ